MLIRHNIQQSASEQLSEKHEKCMIQEGRISIHGMVPTKMGSSTTRSNCVCVCVYIYIYIKATDQIHDHALSCLWRCPEILQATAPFINALRSNAQSVPFTSYTIRNGFNHDLTFWPPRTNFHTPQPMTH